MSTPESDTDWFRWHDVYDNGDPRFASRLRRVQAAVGRHLDAAPAGPIVVLDICGGQGRCVLPVLDDHPKASDVTYQLVEVDERNVEAARAEAERVGVRFVARVADAGVSDTYADLERAHLVVMSGLFVHMVPRERRRTVRHLPEVCDSGARVVWTLREGGEARRLRRAFGRAGFTGEHTRREPEGHRVGEVTLTRPQAPLRPGVRWFTFRPIHQTRGNKARVVLGRWRRIVLRQPPAA